MKVGNKLVVADACVVLKWILPKEEDVSEALCLREDFVKRKFKLLVPAHFLSELMNTLSRKLPSEALSFLSLLLLSPFIQCSLSLELASIAKKLMHKYPKISFYDGFYHAIAIQKGGIFVTADEKYYKAVKKEGHILLLKDYTSHQWAT